MSFEQELERLGRQAKAQVGPADLRLFLATEAISVFAFWSGRFLVAESFVLGTLLMALYFALEAHLNHSVTHGAYAGLRKRLDPRSYETLGLPMRSATWRWAHKIHHIHPSVEGEDPDTMHPIFSKWWHLPLNVFVFETWAFDYDRFLKRKGLRDPSDRGELRKLVFFVLYQYVLFGLLGGWTMVAATLIAVIIRNYIFVALQTGSSVGEGISTWHRHMRGERLIFQIETSKNYRLSAFGTALTGGLDRHIEHHLWPHLPPQRLRALSVEVKKLCAENGVRYVEYSGWSASFADTLRYLSKTQATANDNRQNTLVK